MLEFPCENCNNEEAEVMFSDGIPIGRECYDKRYGDGALDKFFQDFHNSTRRV